MKRINLRLDADLHAWAKAEAKRRGQSLTAYLRQLLLKGKPLKTDLLTTSGKLLN